MSPSVHQGGRGARQRLSRHRANWDQQPILGGGGQNRRPDRGQDAARPPRRRGGGAGPDDRERQGHELPGETERVVQVRTRSKPEPEGRSEEALTRLSRYASLYPTEPVEGANSGPLASARRNSGAA